MLGQAPCQPTKTLRNEFTGFRLIFLADKQNEEPETI
jgi:hypothetical protein